MNLAQLKNLYLASLQPYHEAPWGTQLPPYSEGTPVQCQVLDIEGVVWGRVWLLGAKGGFWQYRIQTSPSNCLWIPEQDLETLDSHRGSGRK
ncbi:hypothetical protein BZZ01_05090 [Nostocales cyanobacterium HT-58-2]|nr:hypothetical protein BZZ01_05090 [Nostocales cyanobacterium HT-58-2]